MLVSVTFRDLYVFSCSILQHLNLYFINDFCFIQEIGTAKIEYFATRCTFWPQINFTFNLIKIKQNYSQLSEKNMMQEAEASETRQAELKEDADHVEKVYKALLENHLIEEKLLRVRKFKIETQLASWLAKYDADIGERQAEFEEISKK